MSALKVRWGWPWLNFYRNWEWFWPRNVTWGEMHRSANDDCA